MVPSATEVQEARELLRKYLRPTRLVSAESLAQHSGARVHLKIESDLPTGSFKPRGALTALLTTTEQRPLKGVVATSRNVCTGVLPDERISRAGRVCNTSIYAEK